MSNVLVWWIGAIHLAIYATVGTGWCLTWAVWKLNRLAGYHAMIVPWYIARLRARKDRP